MRILFLTDNFPPEVNAPASRTYEHCKEWVKQGHDVTVITCFPNYPTGKIFPGYKSSLRKKEQVDGIEVIRVWTYMTNNSGFARRTIDFMSFAVSAFFAGLFVRTDIIVATSPQFFSAVGGRCLSFFKRTPWIMEVRDLWPESIIAVGAIKQKWVISFLEKIEHSLYRSAQKIVVVTDSFKKTIGHKGIESEKIFVVKNGVDTIFTLNGQVCPVPDTMKDIKSPGRFIIGYLGTHGMAHGLEMLLEASDKVRNDDRFHFVLVGDGAEKENLVSLAKSRGLMNVYFLPQVKKEEAPLYLRSFDAVVVPLKKNDLFKTVIPSKIFESAAMEVPILLGVEGEAQALVESYGAGVSFRPEDADDFVNKLLLLSDDGELYRSIQLGCRKLAMDFDRKKLAIEMLKVLTD